MSEIIEKIRNNFRKWKDTFESKGMSVNLEKIKVMFNEGITKGSLYKSKIYPCQVCVFRINANSVLCVKFGCTEICAWAKRGSHGFKKYCLQKE